MPPDQYNPQSDPEIPTGSAEFTASDSLGEPKPASAHGHPDPEPSIDEIEPPPMTPEQEASILRAALAEANEEIARQSDAVQRGLADLANLRRRNDEERRTVQEQANSRLLVHLLPIVDELDLAINHLQYESDSDDKDGSAVAESWAEGVRLIQRKLAAFLESEGVTRIESLGETFNPELHEAVGIAQVGDAESGSIVEVLRQGYRLRNRVVQAAQVVVNQ